MRRNVRSLGQHEIVPREKVPLGTLGAVSRASASTGSGGTSGAASARTLDTPTSLAVNQESLHFSDAEEPFVDVIISFEGDDGAVEFDVRISDLTLEVSTST